MSVPTTMLLIWFGSLIGSATSNVAAPNIATIVSGMFGALIGAGASIGATYLANKHSAKLQAEAEERRRRERIKEYQLDNYLQLQEKLERLRDMCGSRYIALKFEYEEHTASRNPDDWESLLIRHSKDHAEWDALCQDIYIICDRLEDRTFGMRVRLLTAIAATAVLYSNSYEAAEQNKATADIYFKESSEVIRNRIQDCLYR